MKRHISKAWIESGHVKVQTTDGLVAMYPISSLKRLASATDKQINDFHQKTTPIR